jgi:hypothetical protein
VRERANRTAFPKHSDGGGRRSCSPILSCSDKGTFPFTTCSSLGNLGLIRTGAGEWAARLLP